jgi:hypothetical protein
MSRTTRLITDSPDGELATVPAPFCLQAAFVAAAGVD